MFNFKIIDDWKRGFTFISNWCFANIFILEGIRTYLTTFQGYIDDHVFHYGMTALAVLGIVGRFVDQKPKVDNESSN